MLFDLFYCLLRLHEKKNFCQQCTGNCTGSPMRAAMKRLWIIGSDSEREVSTQKFDRFPILTFPLILFDIYPICEIGISMWIHNAVPVNCFVKIEFQPNNKNRMLRNYRWIAVKIYQENRVPLFALRIHARFNVHPCLNYYVRTEGRINSCSIVPNTLAHHSHIIALLYSILYYV